MKEKAFHSTIKLNDWVSYKDPETGSVSTCWIREISYNITDIKGNKLTHVKLGQCSKWRSIANIISKADEPVVPKQYFNFQTLKVTTFI